MSEIVGHTIRVTRLDTDGQPVGEPIETIGFTGVRVVRDLPTGDGRCPMMPDRAEPARHTITIDFAFGRGRAGRRASNQMARFLWGPDWDRSVAAWRRHQAFVSRTWRQTRSRTRRRRR
ncbi:hypothetical protein [Desertimonas flava]|uniref:hypothetical protein n=1 Tax=Desertimonas flava TaxID=2064846 RepID=UPI0013C4D523|nr:hypothetical protein [Desertimonas flava]